MDAIKCELNSSETIKSSDVLQTVAEANRQLLNTIAYGRNIDLREKMEEEKIESKLEMEQMLHSNNEYITLMYPEKTKSQVWNLFRVILYKNVRQHFVTCLVCNCVLIYKSRTGTASLLRHNCYKRMLRQIAEMQGLDGAAKNESDSGIVEQLNGLLQSDESTRTMNFKDEITFDNDDESFESDIDDSSETMDRKLNMNDVEATTGKTGENMLEKTVLEEKIRDKDPDVVIAQNSRRRSSIWEKYELVYYRGIRQNYVQCMECRSLLSYKKKTGSASILRHRCNLKRRLMISQPEVNANALQDDIPCKRYKYDVAFPTETISNLLSLALPMTSVSTTGNQRYSPVANERLTELVIQQILYSTKELGSIEMFSNITFRSMMQLMLNIGSDYGRQNVDSVLPNGALVKTILKNLHHEIEDDLKEVINVNELCCSFNIWSHENHHKISVIGYAITEEFELRKIYLGTETLKFTKPENVLKSIDNILSNYTDSPDVIINKMLIVSDSDLECINEAFDASQIIECSSFQVYNAIENALMKHEDYPKMVDIFSTVYELLESFKANEDFCSGYPQLTSFLQNDLLSKLRMLDGFNTHYEHISEYIAASDRKHRKLLENIDLEFLKSIITLIKPFQQCIDRLSSDDEEQSTINEVYLWKKKLERLCVKGENDSTFIRTIKQALHKQIINNLKITDYHAVALFLDPNFKHMKFLFPEEREKVISIVEKFINKLITSLTGLESQSKQQLDKISSAEQHSTSKVNEMFLEFMDDSSDMPETDDDVAKKEIRSYLETRPTGTQAPLEFWRDQTTSFPYLRELARKILNIPACSIGSKLRFSENGRRFEINRQLVDPEVLSSVLFLNQNISCKKD